jgi:UDP-N-acetylmuramoylalanine--D-glutamate ligase
VIRHDDVAGRRLVVDRLDRDGAALASLLAARGADVVIADPRPEVDTPAGCRLVPDPVSAVGRADRLYVDCWTAETAAHVVRARERGIPVTSLADLVLRESRVPVLGITGTAGKTTTAHLTAALLRDGGMTVEIPGDGRAENAWPSAETLAALDRDGSDIRVLELTSTHLAYVDTSPAIAVVTNLWADHTELHGGEGRYVNAKQRLLAAQRPGDSAVLPVEIDRLRPRDGVRVVRFAAEGARAGAAVAWRDGGIAIAAGEAVEFLSVPPLRPSDRGSLLAAVTAADLLGRRPTEEALAGALTGRPRWRGEDIGSVDGVPVIHGGMAATPAKARALLADYPGSSCIVIVGGMADGDAGMVHASPAEQRLLVEACAVVEQAARRIVAYGPAAARIAPLLAAGADCEWVVGPDLHWAVGAALDATAGVERIVWAPMFPVDLADRERFAALVADAAARRGATWRAAAP